MEGSREPPHGRRWRCQGGFTLVELLVVIVILGLLAGVVVFAVRGTSDKGLQNAIDTDARIIRTALEAYCAQNGTYPGVDPDTRDPMTALVQAEFLSAESDYHGLVTGDENLQDGQGNCNGTKYALSPPESDSGGGGGTQPGEWSTLDATMTQGRAQHSATVLPNDKMWVVGGRGDTPPPGSESHAISSVGVYDAGASPMTWADKEPLALARYGHTATPLDGSTKILLVGGVGPDSVTDSVELYDTSASGGSGQSTISGCTPVSASCPDFYAHGGVQYHTATKVHDDGPGKGNKEYVLVAGGLTPSATSTSTAARYDPQTGAWSYVPDMARPRHGHTATLLPDGRVVVAGGWTLGGDPEPDSAEIYDPRTNLWTDAALMTVARRLSAATELADGRVFVAGGQTTFDWGPDGPHKLRSAEIYDPQTDSWSRVIGDMQVIRRSFTATLLDGGRVLVAGGCCTDAQGTLTATAELFTPEPSSLMGGTWTSAGSMTTARFYHTASRLSNGDVLVVGGQHGPWAEQITDTAELYS